MNCACQAYNSTETITVQSWFIPTDILMIICTTLVIILSVYFLLTIMFNKTCHTISTMLIANTCLTELVLACDLLAMGVFALQNDLKGIEYEDSLCVFRSYLSYVANALQNYSYLLLAIYRYLTISYPLRLFWQTVRTQLVLIAISWILAFMFPFPYLLTGDIRYDVENQMCQVPLRFSFPIVYGSLCVYIIPLTMILVLYVKLVRYVKGMNRRVVPANTLVRARRDLNILRRTVIFVLSVSTIDFPYTVIIFLTYFNRAPIHHFRIGYISTNVSMLFLMIGLFFMTDSLKIAIMKKIKRQPNMVVARVV